jgi:hypothetical protein
MWAERFDLWLSFLPLGALHILICDAQCRHRSFGRGCAMKRVRPNVADLASIFCYRQKRRRFRVVERAELVGFE